MADADFHGALMRIQMDYLEMPELKLTPAQVRKLCTLPADVCDAALAALVASGFLTRSRDGAFLRCDRLPVRVSTVDALTWIVG